MWGWGLRTDRVSISLSRPCIAKVFLIIIIIIIIITVARRAIANKETHSENKIYKTSGTTFYSIGFFILKKVVLVLMKRTWFI